MKIKNKKKLILITAILLLLFIILINTLSFADVGGIQRYDSSSYSNSSSSSSRRSTAGIIDFIFSPKGLIIILVIAAIIFFYLKKKGKINKIEDLADKEKRDAAFNQIKMGANDLKNTMNQMGAGNIVNSILGGTMMNNNTQAVAEQIRAIDPMFSEGNFLTWSKDVFVKLQTAWTKKEWSIIRPFESNELFEQHAQQLQEYINTNRTNIVERINVTDASLYDFKQDGDKEILRVNLKAVMRDYIIDDETKRVLEGRKDQDVYMSYRLTFMRKAGVKTKEGVSNKSTTNCPNCGAPTQITSAGQCEYCQSVITTGEHDWVLCSLEGIK